MTQIKTRRDNKFAQIEISYQESMQRIESDMISKFEEISRKVYGIGFAV